jgi:hypothetical protein
MAQDKEKRIQTAGALLTALARIHATITDSSPEEAVRSFLSNNPVRLSRVLRKPAPRKQLIVAGITALSAVLIAVIFGAFRLSRSPQQSLPIARPAAVLMPDDSAPGVARPTAARAPADLPAQSIVRSETALSSAIKSAPRNQPVRALPRSRPERHFAQSAAGVSGKPAGTVQESTIESEESFLLRLRELDAPSSVFELERALNSREINDGEYYVRFAHYLLYAKRLNEIQPLLEKAQRIPAALLGQEEIAREVLVTEARLLSLRFDAQPSAASANMAMDQWYTVKYQFRKSPGNRYFQLADREIRRINEKLQRSVPPVEN